MAIAVSVFHNMLLKPKGFQNIQELYSMLICLISKVYVEITGDVDVVC